jgi:hypothetical protein
MNAISEAKFIRATPLCHVDPPTLLRIIDGLLAMLEQPKNPPPVDLVELEGRN